MRFPAVFAAAAVALLNLQQTQHHFLVLAEPAPPPPRATSEPANTDATPLPTSPPPANAVTPPSSRIRSASAKSKAFIRKLFSGESGMRKADDDEHDDGRGVGWRREGTGAGDRESCEARGLPIGCGNGEREDMEQQQQPQQHGGDGHNAQSEAASAGSAPGAGSCVAAASARDADSASAATGSIGADAAREFVVAAAAVVSAAVPATREAPEINASIEGGGGGGGGGFDCTATAAAAVSGEVAEGAVGAHPPRQPSVSPPSVVGQKGEKRDVKDPAAAAASDATVGEGLGMGSGGVREGHRAGWRIGEGLAVPSDGVDAKWSRLKEFFERREAAGGGDGVALGGGVERGAGGAERRRGRVGKEDLVVGVLPEERREAVLAAIRWAWKGYTRYAWGTDELRPLTRRGKDSFRLGLTIVDSMDTLWLAGEREEFDRCLDWVTNVMDLDVDQDVNVFETTIRVLGGLLAAYHLSGEKALLSKAEDLGRRLSEAFGSPSGIPYSDVNLKSGLAFNPASSPGSSLSEATTLQLEFSYLTKLTGNPLFHDVAQQASDAVEKARLELAWDNYERGLAGKKGLAPVFVDPEAGLFGESGGAVGAGAGLVTLGARGDSYYEYLLKQWLFSGKEDTNYLHRYQEALRAVEAKLLRRSYPGELLFVGELVGDSFSAKMDHLVCFLPGTLALGYLQGAAGRDGDKHLSLARELMETCYQMYERTGTGLAPEIVHFNTRDSLADKGGDSDLVIKRRDRHNILRPEALESLYYLYWITREEAYRDQAWAIFEAFEEHCRVDQGGYAGLEDVTDVRSKRINKMETFFVSESLKYLLLIFSEENPLPFDRYVLNTEAHGFPIS